MPIISLREYYMLFYSTNIYIAITVCQELFYFTHINSLILLVTLWVYLLSPFSHEEMKAKDTTHVLQVTQPGNDTVGSATPHEELLSEPPWKTLPFLKKSNTCFTWRRLNSRLAVSPLPLSSVTEVTECLTVCSAVNSCINVHEFYGPFYLYIQCSWYARIHIVCILLQVFIKVKAYLILNIRQVISSLRVHMTRKCLSIFKNVLQP